MSEVLFVEEDTGSTTRPDCVLPVGLCDRDIDVDTVVEGAVVGDARRHVPHVSLQTSRAGPIMFVPSFHDEVSLSQIICLRSLPPSHSQVRKIGTVSSSCFLLRKNVSNEFSVHTLRSKDICQFGDEGEDGEGGLVNVFKNLASSSDVCPCSP